MRKAELRLLTIRDLPDFLRWGKVDDPRLEHYSFSDFDLEDLEAWYYSKQKFLVRKIFGLFVDGEAVGFITLKKINFISRSAEIGLAINPDRYGRGYATLMIRTLLHDVYDAYPIDTIFLDVAEFNHRARRLYEKCGFMYIAGEEKAYEHQRKDLPLRFPGDFIFRDGRVQTTFFRMSHFRQTLCVEAPAKLNFGLRVCERMPSGYHRLVSTMQSITLSDVIFIRLSRRRRIKEGSEDFGEHPEEESPAVLLRSFHEGIPSHKNLAYIAARKYLEKFASVLPKNASSYAVELSLYKRIPEGAGMGGGSADAAAVLRGLNECFGFPVTVQQLEELALEIGSDVPFCVEGGTALAGGRGEELERYAPAVSRHILLWPSETVLSTKAVFERLDALRERSGSPDSGEKEGAKTAEEAYAEAERFRLRLENGETLSGESVPPNDMEPAADALSGGEIVRKKRAMLEAGAEYAAMTGSGATVYGLFDSAEAAETAAGTIPGSIVCRTV